MGWRDCTCQLITYGMQAGGRRQGLGETRERGEVVTREREVTRRGERRGEWILGKGKAATGERGVDCD